MIEKLKKKQTKFGYLSEASPLDILDKINELVDAVNELTNCVGQLGVEFTNEETKEPADPYAEHYICKTQKN